MADYLMDQMMDDYGFDGPYGYTSYKRPTLTCYHCNKSGLIWKIHDGKYRVSEKDGSQHYCYPELKQIIKRMKQIKNKKGKMIELFRTAVAGLQHGDIQKVNPKFLKAGQVCQLFWERSNQYDPMAIKIVIDGHRVGYIPKKLTHGIHMCRDKKIKVSCEISGYFPNNNSWTMLHVVIKNMETEHNGGEDVEL